MLLSFRLILILFFFNIKVSTHNNVNNVNHGQFSYLIIVEAGELITIRYNFHDKLRGLGVLGRSHLYVIVEVGELIKIRYNSQSALR